MSSNRIARTSVAVAYSLSLLVTGALLLPPAAAAIGIDWGSAWKHEIKPRADQRYYTKAQAQKRFAPALKVLRGAYGMEGYADNTSVGLATEIDFGGVTLAKAPTVHFIGFNDPSPAACPGTPVMPDAKPGHLCVYETTVQNVQHTGDLSPQIVAPAHGGFAADRYGAILQVFPENIGNMTDWGTWAVRPPKG
jgi:hypothetical protein